MPAARRYRWWSAPIWAGVAVGVAFGLVLILFGSFGVFERPYPSSKSGRERRTVEEERPLRPLAQRSLRPALAKLARQGVQPPEVRNSLLDSLGRDLSHEEIESLLDYLEALQPTAERVAEYAAHVNEILNTIHRQSWQPPRMAEVVIALSENEAQPALVRQYAVQHLAIVWNRAHDHPAIRTMVEASLWESFDTAEPGRAGTALVALHNLGRPTGSSAGATHSVAGSHSARLARTALASIGEETPTQVRLAAVRILGERGVREAADPLRRLAADSAVPVIVRMAATAQLGRLGGPEDIQLLQTLLSNPRLSHSARAALDRLGAAHG